MKKLSEQELQDRIKKLEIEVEPLMKELKSLRRQLASKRGGIASVKNRTRRGESLNAWRDRIKKELRANSEDLYKRNGGLLKRIADREEVSTRTIGKIHSEIKQEFK